MRVEISAEDQALMRGAHADLEPVLDAFVRDPRLDLARVSITSGVAVVDGYHKDGTGATSVFGASVCKDHDPKKVAYVVVNRILERMGKRDRKAPSSDRKHLGDIWVPR